MSRHRRSLAWAALALFGLAAIAGAAPRHRISGEVRAGERFVRRFADSLQFVLEPSAPRDGGWSIAIYARDSLADFAAIATPPFRGPNPIRIYAWNFRNENNTRPNRGSVNAPQGERDFFFVTRLDDYDRAAAALDVLLWPADRSEAVVDSARAAFDALPTGQGRLRITRMKPGDLGAGRKHRIESMRFVVELQMP